MSDTTPGYDFLEYVLKSILDFSDDLSIEQKVDDLGILLTVKVNEKDMGKIIGKGGQTVKALRVILRLVGAKCDQRINLKIYDSNERQYGEENF